MVSNRQESRDFVDSSHQGGSRSTLLTFAVSVAVGLGLWEAAVRLLSIPAYLLPAPSKVANKIVAVWPLLAWHSYVTLTEVIVGLAIGATLGFTLACLMAQSEKIERSIYPFVLVSQTFPKEALAPLLLIWLGYGIWPKVAVAALISFFPIAISTLRGLTTVEPVLVDVMRTLAASKWDVFWKLRLPNSLPHLMSGLKMGATLSVIGAVVGEFVGSDAGLGHLIQVGNSQLSTDLTFAALFALGAMSLGLFLAVEAIERQLLSRYDRVTYFDLR